MSIFKMYVYVCIYIARFVSGTSTNKINEKGLLQGLFAKYGLG